MSSFVNIDKFYSISKGNIDNVLESDFSNMSIGSVKALLKEYQDVISEKHFSIIVKKLDNDGRIGLVKEISRLEKHIQCKTSEEARINDLYEYEISLAHNKPEAMILGMDEVGRGPLAGPLTVGGVILKHDLRLLGLNDSKKLSPDARKSMIDDIKLNSIVHKTFSIPPQYIDSLGMTECLRRAFANIIQQIEKDGIHIDVILLDGNPLHLDPREINVIKGDAKCASISAASILAKVERDEYMEKISSEYPEYDFKSNKGYGTKAHTDAIKVHGLSPIHRKSFCKSFLQTTLF